jgi:hypothetical protein
MQGVMSDVAQETEAAPDAAAKQDRTSQLEANDDEADEGAEDLQDEVRRRLETDG